jgi:hypothetical protein
MIKLTSKISIDDIRDWSFNGTTIIEANKNSSFEIGALGPALSFISGFNRSTHKIIVECDHDEPTNTAELEQTIFNTAFGFSLSRIASSITFNNIPASKEFKPLLGATYNIKHGVLGDGKSSSLVCIDPKYPTPPFLVDLYEIEAHSDFPAPSAFATAVKRVTSDLGFTNLLRSNSETPIVSYIYELLRNTLEHGIQSDPLFRSTRALIFEKIILRGTDISSRRIPNEIKDFLSRRIAIANESGDKGLGVLCITVADQGHGIQSTLPPERKEESSEEVFFRAFKEGESRKPKGLINRGLGLANVITATHQLSGLFYIQSGNLFCIQDFAEDTEKYPRINKENIKKFQSKGQFGTSVSIYIPEYSFDVDQRTLF